MAAWGLLLSALTIGASMITKNDLDRPAKGAASSAGRQLQNMDNRLFLSGAGK